MSSPRVLIIDDHADFRRLLGHHITVRWPRAVIREHDPVSAGPLPAGDFATGNDLVLLGHPAGGSDALAWLQQLRQVPRCPPVIFFGNGAERQIVEAIKAGAEDYIGKVQLAHARLIAAMEHALAAGAVAAGAKPAAAAQGPPAMRSFPGYELMATISEGGISGVYLTRERSSGRMVVLKVLRQVPDAGGDRHFERFLAEYHAIARVRHPNVVRIHDLGVADDHAFIAMEYCSAGSLKRRIQSGIEAAQAWAWMRTMAGALGALHAAGICHRDFKPTNIMFREDGSPVLIDFGLAKEAQVDSGITSVGAIFGTPFYMSPEQGAGTPVDARSDIYSLGVVFFEMLTGAKPFTGTTAMSVIIQHREVPPPCLTGELVCYQPLLDRMLAKRPDDRFRDIDELLAWRPAAG